MQTISFKERKSGNRYKVTVPMTVFADICVYAEDENSAIGLAVHLINHGFLKMDALVTGMYCNEDDDRYMVEKQ